MVKDVTKTVYVTEDGVEFPNYPEARRNEIFKRLTVIMDSNTDAETVIDFRDEIAELLQEYSRVGETINPHPENLRQMPIGLPVEFADLIVSVFDKCMSHIYNQDDIDEFLSDNSEGIYRVLHYLQIMENK